MKKELSRFSEHRHNCACGRRELGTVTSGQFVCRRCNEPLYESTVRETIAAWCDGDKPVGATRLG